MDGLVDGWMDGWMEGWMDVCLASIDRDSSPIHA